MKGVSRREAKVISRRKAGLLCPHCKGLAWYLDRITFDQRCQTCLEPIPVVLAGNKDHHFLFSLKTNLAVGGTL